MPVPLVSNWKLDPIDDATTTLTVTPQMDLSFPMSLIGPLLKMRLKPMITLLTIYGSSSGVLKQMMC